MDKSNKILENVDAEKEYREAEETISTIEEKSPEPFDDVGKDILNVTRSAVDRIEGYSPTEVDVSAPSVSEQYNMNARELAVDAVELVTGDERKEEPKVDYSKSFSKALLRDLE